MNRLITWFPTLAPYHRRYAALSGRERFLVNIAASLLVGVFLVYVALFPALEYRDSKLREQYVAAQGLDWMEVNKEQAIRSSPETVGTQADNRLTSLSSSASLNSITIKRMQPSDSQINVEIAGQEYLSVIKWLVALETEYGFKLIDLRLDKSEEGIVDCRITLI